MSPPLVLPSLTLGVRWSVCVRDLAAGVDAPALASYDADVVLRTASIGKVFLLVEVAARAEAGTLDLGEPITWSGGELVADSGLWHRLRQRTQSIGDLAWLVGALSDNLATNVLLRRVGVTAVRARARELGCVDSALLDRVRDDRGPTDPPTLSRGRADELSAVLAGLARGDVVSPAVSARVVRWLSAGADLSMVASAFGLDPLAHADPDRGITLVNKTGTISVVRADVGVVRGPAASVAYAVLAEWAEDDDPRDAVLDRMRAIGTTLRRHVGG